jgi:hypothetical protein
MTEVTAIETKEIGIEAMERRAPQEVVITNSSKVLKTGSRDHPKAGKSITLEAKIMSQALEIPP